MLNAREIRVCLTKVEKTSEFLI